MACRFVLALSSSAQGAGGGRSPISGGGRKERAGLGAVGGGAAGLGAGAAETWLGNFGQQATKTLIIEEFLEPTNTNKADKINVNGSSEGGANG